MMRCLESSSASHGPAVKALRESLAKIEAAEAAYGVAAREMDAWLADPRAAEPPGLSSRCEALYKRIEYARAELQGCVAAVLRNGWIVDAPSAAGRVRRPA